MNSNLDETVALWMKWDKNNATRSEVSRLVETKQTETLKKLMCGQLSFGTAGIRAEMSAGFNRLNDLVVIQLTQGMLKYLQRVFENLKDMGIVIGFDSRHNSKRFAELTANIFLQNGIKVYWFSEVAPTPLVPYAVSLNKCAAGIMVTASHNPKKDNGYKVYWSNGAQVLSPHDTGICEETLRNMEPWPGSWDCKPVLEFSLSIDCLEKTFSSYISDSIAKFCHYKKENSATSLRFTYTAFHGVGALYTPKLIEAFGFKRDCIVFVEEQTKPDPEFPTMKFPNPEEGRSVLELAIATAEKNNSTIVLANDPDADRFQLAEKQADGEWRIFTGNEIGGLLSWWAWKGWKILNPNKSGQDVYMLNSTVSSKFMKTFAEHEGFNYEETLTGFKWMGNRAQELRNAGKEVLLAWEESIGYMCGDSLDKDGVLAAAMFAEMGSFLERQNLTYAQQLDNLYQRYGYHLTFGSYYISEDSVVTKTIFDRLRNFEGPNKYPTKCRSFAIPHVRDLTTGYDSSQPDGKPVLPVSASSQMITFTCEDGSTFTIRGSGTEPKLKFYIEVKTEPNSNFHAALAKLEDLKMGVIEDFIQPQLHNLPSKE